MVKLPSRWNMKDILYFFDKLPWGFLIYDTPRQTVDFLYRLCCCVIIRYHAAWCHLSWEERAPNERMKIMSVCMIWSLMHDCYWCLQSWAYHADCIHVIIVRKQTMQKVHALGPDSPLSRSIPSSFEQSISLKVSIVPFVQWRSKVLWRT
jgi:hypothetical protein